MNKTKLAIIGSGPAGYTAAIYAARADLKPIVIGGIKSGGQLMFTTQVENFPGFKDGKNGPELMIEMRSQAEKFGTQMIDTWVTAVDFSARPFKLWTNLPEGFDPMQFEYMKPDDWNEFSKKVKSQPHDIEADSVIVSTGAASIMLGIPGEKELLGKGVATCAVCDAAFYKDKVAYVIGGGDSAMEDATALSKFAREVKIIHRRDSFRASKIMQDRVLSNPKIKILWNSEVVEAIGKTKLEKIKIKDLKTNKVTELETDGLFYAIGHRPLTQLFTGQLQLDDHGYLLTRQSLTKQGLELASQHINEKGLLEYPSMTSVNGVFAAGDVVDVRYKQAVTSAGQGTQAALDVEKWLEVNETS
ncbi:MAG: thioredoxin-disulfide reductase [Patescibacteria group bacterium]